MSSYKALLVWDWQVVVVPKRLKAVNGGG